MSATLSDFIGIYLNFYTEKEKFISMKEYAYTDISFSGGEHSLYYQETLLGENEVYSKLKSLVIPNLAEESFKIINEGKVKLSEDELILLARYALTSNEAFKVVITFIDKIKGNALYLLSHFVHDTNIIPNFGKAVEFSHEVVLLEDYDVVEILISLLNDGYFGSFPKLLKTAQKLNKENK